jgi:hypothetical protein
MATISEALAVSALEKRSVACPFRGGKKHRGDCICRGSMKVSACDKCDGSGWDAAKDRPCQACGGRGAHCWADDRRAESQTVETPARDMESQAPDLEAWGQSTD